MYRPTPGPFQGSMPSPDLAGAQHARRLDVSFSVLALLAAAGVWIGANLSGPHPDVVAVAKASSVVLLVTALTGMWMIERSAEVPRLAVTMLAEIVRRRMDARAQRRAVSLAPDETPASGLGGLLEGFLEWLERLGEPSGRSDPSPEAAGRREQAQRLVADLYREADGLSDTSNDIEDSARRLTGELSGAERACNLTGGALSRVIDRAAALTGAVTGTTAEAQRMTAASVDLSNLAFESQRCVAGLDDRTAELMLNVSRIEGLLARANGVSEAACNTASRLGPTGAPVATLALELRALGQATRSALSGIEESLAEMSAQANAAAKTARQIGERLSAQHELGLGLTQAVAQQGAEIAQILSMLDEAQSGFQTLRASVDQVSRYGVSRHVQMTKLRDAASRLPTHAENLANVLRDVPDFAPPIEFEF